MRKIIFLLMTIGIGCSTIYIGLFYTLGDYTKVLQNAEIFTDHNCLIHTYSYTVKWIHVNSFDSHVQNVQFEAQLLHFISSTLQHLCKLAPTICFGTTWQRQSALYQRLIVVNVIAANRIVTGIIELCSSQGTG